VKDTADYKERRDAYRQAFDVVKDEYGPNVYVMDEAGCFRNQISRQTYDQKGVNTASVRKKFRSTENNRDTVVGCMGKTGVKVPLFYIKHCGQRSKKKVVIQRKVSGMNKDIQAFWLVKIFLPFLRSEHVKAPGASLHRKIPL
jgi:hypothetical protein